MFKILRKKGVMKKLLWLVAIVIMITFGFLGTANLVDSYRKQAAGKIFKRKVSLEDFDQAYKFTRQQALLRYGENLSKIEQFLNLEDQAWERLILLHEAKKRRLKVSNQDIIDTIAGYPFFQRDGRFDQTLYKDIVRYFFKSRPRDFEEGIRQTLIITKLFEEISSEITFEDEEIRTQYIEKNEKVQVDYVLFKPEQYTNEVILEEDSIRDYYEANKENLRLPPGINAEYLYIPYPADAEKKGIDEVKAKANLLAMELLLTPNLKEVGQKYELQAKETGFFSREKPNFSLGWSYELLQSVFELEENKISQPIETAQGYYIVHMKEKRDAYIPDYPEAKPKIEEILIKQKTDEIAQAKATEYLDKIQKELETNPDKNFSEITESLKLQLQQTPLFNRKQYLPTVGVSRDFQEAAFALHRDNKKISEVVATPNGYAILHFVSYEPISEEKFQEEKEDFREKTTNAAKNNVFNDFVEQLKLKANLKDLRPKPETEEQETVKTISTENIKIEF